MSENTAIQIILGLGSNLGNRMHYLDHAVSLMSSSVNDITCSRVYASDALLPDGAPPQWNTPFYNICVMGTTTLHPGDLLSTCQEAESLIGRERYHERWAPRKIDIDILAYGGHAFASDNLTIPHPGLASRPFFIWPFAELWPSWKHPTKHITAIEMAQAFDLQFPEQVFHAKTPLNTVPTAQTITFKDNQP